MGFAPRLTSTEPLVSSRVFSVERRHFDDDADGFVRDVAVHPGAVAVLAAEGDEVVLVRQWRAPLEARVLEVVAGTRDVAGEPAESTARRELEEEAGLACDTLEPLASFWNSPGWSTQRTDVFLATGLREVARRPSGPEEAAIEVVRLGLDDALEALEQAGPADATTLIALRAYQARRR